ncbi:hypothetical protein GCM10027280_59680 [Micromonospora polyrhachis]|uniref:Glycosyl hydrolase family 98 putative carbohydrate-binding module domain-containing protein n=1 Tax=Micromonospora polyrhachis TaxID=1282883 RepID=A0A7W7SVC1_9ACTN|nr:NPCBM/NEW2 domain-containing protein [Micromonospora polyrhachis]MBB4961226.1 hypothetical protein [Micromonospora polyrhachis]
MRSTLLAVVVLAVAVLVSWLASRRVGRRGGGRIRQPRIPQPGEIWWAYVPFREIDEEKHRPCLVLNVTANYIDILKITSQDKSHRTDHIEIPTRSWSPNSTKNSFLDLSAPIRIGWADLDRRAGVVDAGPWQRVCQLHQVGRTIPQPPAEYLAPLPRERTNRPVARVLVAVVTFFAVLCVCGPCLNNFVPFFGSSGNVDGSQGDTHLYRLTVVAGDASRSGYRIDSTLAGDRYPKSTALWVGCDGKPLTISYEIDGRYKRLAATAGLDAHTPAGLAAKIVVAGDGKTRKSVTVTRDTTAAIDIDVTGVRLLTLSAVRTKGSCELASRPYGALGDALLIR